MPYTKFAETVRGWWTYDGGDYCPECWKKFLRGLQDSVRNTIRLDARLLASPEFAEAHRCLAGYCASCEICFKDVFVASSEEEGKVKEIKIVKREGCFNVMEKEGKAKGCGSTLHEAIGEMMKTNAEHFGFEFVWDIKDHETLKFITSKLFASTMRKRRKRSRTIKLNPKPKKGVF